MPDIERVHVYRFCPRCGAEAMQVVSRQQVHCGACGLDMYHNPCAATALILLDREEQVLLVERAHDPARGKLAFPGGFVDDDESVEEALRREVREEVGLEVGPLQFLASAPNTYPYGGLIYPTLDLFFTGRVDGFHAAQPLDGVSRLVVRRIDAVDPAELAFDSMRRAWQAFLDRRAQA